MRTALIAFVALMAPSALAAQGWITPPLPHRGDAFPVVKIRTEVSVRVEGSAARVEVSEWFENRGARVAEGDYLYPLPGEAVFSDFSLFVGEQELRGETMDAARARAIYEEIVRRHRDPALIELVGHGLVRARVFPIQPGETRRITMRYTQLLERQGDALQFRYAAGSRGPSPGFTAPPLPGPRPIDPPRPLPAPGTEPRPFPGETDVAHGPTGVRGQPERVPLTFRLTAEDGERFAEPFSPTHRLRVERDGPRLVVRPESELSGDFSVFLPLAREVVGVTVVTHRPAGEDGYFMMTLSPGRATGPAVPRDLVAVLDVSGSMAGEKIAQARDALRQLLGGLGDGDRFRLVAFSNGVSAYASGWSEATRAELDRARQWVDGLEASGGTNISGALSEAFRVPSPEDRLRIVVFLTDGLPTVGETDPERIAAEAERSRGETRVFAFGIGFDVNAYLLDRLSEAARGSTQYIAPDEDVERPVAVLAAKIRHPVLTDLELADAPVRLNEIYPLRLPDLFAGEDLVLFGRYAGGDEAVEGDVVVTGRRGGRTERYTTRATFAGHETGNAYVARLWAARKIGVLTQSLRLNGHDPEVVEEIRRTALRYGILSEFTSHLVQEPAVALDANPRDGLAFGGLVPPPVPVAQSTLRTWDVGGGVHWMSGGPQASVGAAAVYAAEKARAQREASSMVDLALTGSVDGPGTAAAQDQSLVAVAGRTFRWNNGEWRDVLLRDRLDVIEIAAFGEAYFELLRRAPELASWFGLGERVVVAGAEVGIRVAPDGKERLSSAELDRIVRAFRGE